MLVIAIAAAYLGAMLLRLARADGGRASAVRSCLPLVKAGLLLAGLLIVTWWIDKDRGWSYLWLLFVLLVVLMDLALRRTRWGRHLFAVGGNEEASRRSGIKVNRVYVSVFVLCSTLAALGGLLAAGQHTAVSAVHGHHGHQPDRDRGGRHRWHRRCSAGAGRRTPRCSASWCCRRSRPA